MIAEAGYFILYLFYGLVFFTIGAAITSRDLRFSDLRIAKILWLFAMFAYLHGMNEWLDLFMRINRQYTSGTVYTYLQTARLLLLGLSFGFLLWFGLELSLNRRFNRTWVLGAMLIVTLGLTPLISANLQEHYRLIDSLMRYLLALPGALLSGLGFIKYGALKDSADHRGGQSLIHAGYAMLLYGFFTGVLPSGWTVLGFPVEVFRALTAALILHCIMKGLQIFDFGHRNKIEEQLRRFAQSEKMVALGKLSAGIAHEINNPLTNVLLKVEMLEQELRQANQLSPGYQSRIEAIKRNLDRASKIASELLFFSHNREIELEPFDLNEVIDKTFHLIGSRQNLYDFKRDLGVIPELEGIPWKVEEVLLNLLMNAMEATPQGGCIEVSTQVANGGVKCTVRDHGSGIRAEDLRFVFDPFFTTKEPGKGTGLGLSICFGIMEMHGGSILLNSKLGEGATAQLFFPLPKGSAQ